MPLLLCLSRNSPDQNISGAEIIALVMTGAAMGIYVIGPLHSVKP
jgi:hypothetical protein